MLVAAFILMENIPGRITIVALIILKYWYFFFKIKTIEGLCKVESDNKSPGMGYVLRSRDKKLDKNNG